MTKQETTLTPEIAETPKTQEVVSDVIEKKENWEKTKELIEDTKKEFLKQSWPLSYKETKKMEEGFGKIFIDLTPQWVLKTLQDNMSDIFKDVEDIEDALTILKEGKDGDDKNLELWKNENLYHWLKDHINREEGKEEHIQELKEQLEKEKEPIIEQIVKKSEKQEQEEKPKNKKHNNEQKEARHKKKSESKLWNSTKKILDRSLEHTWIGKHFVKKPAEWIWKKIKKPFKK